MHTAYWKTTFFFFPNSFLFLINIIVNNLSGEIVTFLIKSIKSISLALVTLPLVFTSCMDNYKYVHGETFRFARKATIFPKYQIVHISSDCYGNTITLLFLCSLFA